MPKSDAARNPQPSKRPAKKAAGAASAKSPTKTPAKTSTKTPAKTPATAKAAAKTPRKTTVTTAPSKPSAKAPSKASSNGASDHGAKPVSKDGIVATRDFDLAFLRAQRQRLEEQRLGLVGQANRLDDEARSLIEEAEMGDVQFDDESGEGDTMVVERERDQVLSASARHDIELIDAAIARLAEGTYGYSLVSGEPIPRERLEAIPWATELVGEKVGWLGRR